MIFFILLCSLLFTNVCYSQISRNFNQKDKPIYEFGAGAIALSLPNYPGSNSDTLRVIPFPWIIYRGDVLKADEEGNRLQFFKSDRFEVGLSGGYNFPIESSDNEARKGMADTESLLGIGPGIIYRVLPKSKTTRLTLGLGLRANIAATGDLYIREQGLLIEPNIRLWKKPSEKSMLTFFASMSLSFADQKYCSFFYDIDEKDETDKRKKYKAKSGLVDIATSLGFALDITKSISFFAGTYYSNLTMSANKESYLLENQHNIGYLFGIAWMFYEQHSTIKIKRPFSSDPENQEFRL